MYYVIAYCAHNPGDDMLVRTLVRRYPKAQFYLHALPAFSGFLVSEPNLIADGRFKTACFRLARKLNSKFANDLLVKETERADAVIRIGGSIFIERPDSAKRFYPDTNPNVFIMGANFGPYRSRLFFDTRKQRIRNARDCCFRDSYSYQLFRDIPTVRYAPDILFGYPYYPAYQKGEEIGVSVIDFSRRGALCEHQEMYEKGLVAICDRYTGLKKRVVLLSFCEPEGDRDACDRVYEACQDKDRVEIVSYRGEIDPFLDELNRCEIIYATRFHAMIFGWAMQKKVIPVIYSEKQKNVLEDIGFSGAVWDVFSGEEPDDHVISADPERLDPALLEQLRLGSQEHFSALDSFINTSSASTNRG